MRGHLVCVMLAIVPTIAWARSDGIPTLDVRPVCRGIASQSADPGVGQTSQTQTFQQCMESEQAVLEQLKRGWSAFSAEDKRHCVTLATTGGESSNTELLTCLEMSRDVRTLRSAASGAEMTRPAPSLSTPTAQPTTAVPAPEKEVPKQGGARQEALKQESLKQESLKQESLKQEGLKQEVLKREVNEAKSEVERAKLEAQTAKASEELVQRKLADAEAALKKAKDEAQRASAEVERAKAEAQSARESEAAMKTKLADAAAARARSEQTCGSGDTRPSLGTRLRRWLGRPGSPNP